MRANVGDDQPILLAQVAADLRPEITIQGKGMQKDNVWPLAAHIVNQVGVRASECRHVGRIKQGRLAPLCVSAHERNSQLAINYPDRAAAASPALPARIPALPASRSMQ